MITKNVFFLLWMDEKKCPQIYSKQSFAALFGKEFLRISLR